MVVGLYFAAMAWIGWFFSRRNRNFSDFMFGGGQMPWLAIGISLIATSVSATTFLGNPADTFGRDMSLLMLNFGSIFAIILIGWIFIPRFKNSGIRSAYELLERRFSRPVRVLAASLYCLHLVLRSGILIYGPALVLEKITGAPLPLSICLMSLMAVAYTYYGGIRAVTWTDVVQFLIFFASGMLAVGVIANAVGSFSETWELAAQAGKTQWFNRTFDPSNARNFWSAGIAYIGFETAIRGCDQQFVQRYLACKSIKEANYSSISSVLLGVCVGLLFFTLGAFLFVYYRVRMVEMLPAGMNVNEVFPHFILHAMPTGFKGLLVAAILAAAMSSLSSAYAALSNTTVVDFLNKASTLKEASHLKQARNWVLIWGVIATFAAFLSMLGNVSLLTKALFFTSLFIGPLLGLFLLAFYLPSTKPAAVLVGAVLGMLSLLPLSDIPILPPGVWTPLYALAWPWNPLVSLTSTLAFALLSSFLMPRKKESTYDVAAVQR